MSVRRHSGSKHPTWAVWHSIGVGVLGVYAVLWFAARAFRIGILLTGKPPDFRTLIRWVRMS